MNILNNEQRLLDINSSLLKGENDICGADVIMMNDIASAYINNTEAGMTNSVNLIIKISNLLYNNTSDTMLPLDEGVYDLVVAKYNKETNGMAPIGAIPVSIKSKEQQQEKKMDIPKVNLDPIKVIDRNKMSFYNNISFNREPYRSEDFIINTSNDVDMSKLTRNIIPVYPELIGTLHKCKFVRKYDALAMGVDPSDPSVNIFEKDFFRPTFDIAMTSAMKNKNENFVEMIAELKYDGVSVEADVIGDTIVSANSRGDTEAQKAADYTSIFGGKKFYRAKNVNKNLHFGIKFECIITYSNLIRLKNMYGISYKNPRVAVSGLLSNLNAAKYRDFLTLVPIKTSGLQFNSMEEEVKFLNTYYSTGVDMRYVILRGNYEQILMYVKRFVDEAEYMRDTMDFVYDGVVITYTDPFMKQYLGRKNSIDLWSMAIKFNAKKKSTYFIKYEFTVGQDGRITPIAYFNTVEFFGTLHNKTTIHSYRRFRQLSLREGDMVNIRYTNDVICYLSKPDNEYNRSRDKEIPPVSFPHNCPSCGCPLTISGDSAYCTNPNCPEKVTAKVGNMLKKLQFKDFGRKYIDKLQVTNLTSLLNISSNQAKTILGDVMGSKFMDRIHDLLSNPINDYQIVGSIGFTSISTSRWKDILQYIPLERIISSTDSNLAIDLSNIKGIGDTIISIIVHERKFFMDDLITIRNMKNVVLTYGNYMNTSPQVRFSGVRDKGLEDLFNSKGYEANGDKSVTKHTSILIVPSYDFRSNKVEKALQYGVLMLTPKDAISYLNKPKDNYII